MNLVSQMAATFRFLAITLALSAGTALAQPANDLFALAQAVSGASGAVTTSNVGATREAGEPCHTGNCANRSIWFSFTATGTATATFDTVGSNFDTTLAIYTGSSVSGLTEIASNDDIDYSAGNVQSRATFTAIAGTTYFIAVDGYLYSDGTQSEGTVVLNFAGPGGGGGGGNNDFFGQAQVITGGSGTVTDTNVGATTEAGEPGNFGYATIWFRWTAPGTGTAQFRTAGSNFDTMLGGFSGTTIGGLTTLDFNDDFTGVQSQITFNVTAGATYYIVVSSYYSNEPGDVVLNWNGPAGGSNDFFASPTDIASGSGTFTSSNTSATREADEPCHAGNCANRSIWFRWTAPAGGTIAFNTLGSDFDTTLGIYTGSAVGALTLVTSNDDVDLDNLTSEASFSAVAGTVYYIAVDGYLYNDGTQSQGRVVLNWAPGGGGGGGNDFFATPTVLSGASGSVQSFNTAASREAGEPCHTGNCGNRSIWFRWTATGTGTATFDTVGASFDTVLAIYTGSALGALTEIAANDDIDFSNNNLQSRASFGAIMGTVYYVAVDGFLDEGVQSEGNVVLNWSGPGPAVGNNFFANATQISAAGGSIGGTVVGADLESGEPQHAGNAGGHSVWYRWAPPTAGDFIFETTGSAFNTTLGVYTGGAVNALTQVAANNDISAGNLQSRVNFSAVAGTTYYIAVDGADGATGDLTLAWRSANVVDLLPDLMSPADAARGWIHGWRFDRSSIAGRTLMRVTTGTPNVGTGPLELQGNTQTPDVVQRIYRSDGSTYTRPAGTFTFHPEHGHLHFDNFMQFRLRAVGPDNSVGAILATGAKMSFAIIDLGVYDRTLPGSPASGRYSGGLLQGISVGYTDIYDQSISGQHIDITDIAPGRYWLEAEVDPENRVLEINEGNNFGRILVDLSPPTPPANDAFANAFPSLFASESWTGNTMGATVQAGEPAHYGWLGNSVWFRWTAPFTGSARVTTQGSDFDTVLAFYSGSALSTLGRLAESDDYVDRWSRVDVSVTTGNTYYIAVDGYSGAVGNYVLNINPSGNDNFGSAIALAGPSGAIGGSTLQATRQTGEPQHANVGALAGSIWYSWTPSASGEAVFTTVGSNFDTVLGVYTGAAVDGLSLIAADDDAAGNNLSRVTFNATAGTRYYIAVDGFGTDRGFVTLAWTAGAACVAPTIVEGPLSRPAQLGNEVTFSVVATGTGALNYQWLYSAQAGVEGTPIANGGRVSGADTANLRITGIELGDAGFYSVRVSACDPVLSANAQAAQLVVTSDVGVHVEPAIGLVGQTICTAIELSASGGETFISGTVVFNPSVFANPRITAIAGIPAHTLNTSVSAGHIGFVISLTGGASFGPGHHHVLQLCLDATASAQLSPIGFDNQLQAMMVMAGGAHRDNAVFAPSSITVTRPTRGVGSFNAQNQYVLTLTGEPGAQVRLSSATVLGGWGAATSVTLDANGTATVVYPRQMSGDMFYLILPGAIK